MSLIASLPAAFGRTLPVILQTEATECGLACLGMVSGYHGRRTDLAQLRRQFSISQHGATLGQLIGIANALGLASRPLRLDLEDLGQLRTPCILHWNLNHFVVLKKVTRRGILIHDPASGARWVAHDEISRSFTGVALELWPSAEFRPSAPPPAIRFRDLIGRVDGLFSAATQVLILAAALEVFALASPFYLQWVIDHVLVSADRDLLTTLALGFGLLLIVQQLFSALRSWILLHIGTNLSLQWRTNVFAHLLRLPVQYFEKRHLGDVVSRFGAVDEIQSKLTASFFSVLIDGVMSAVTLAMMFLYSPALAWMALAAMLTYALIRALWFRPLRLATEQEIVHHASQQSHFLETVRGIKAVKLFQRQNERRSGWLSLVVEQVNAGVRTQRLFIAFESINGLLFGLVGIAILWLGARQTLDGLMTVGVLMAFKAYKDQFDGRVAGLIEKFFELRMLRLQGERLADIVLTQPEKDAPAGPGREVASLGAPAVRLQGLRFRYAETDPWVVDGIDLEIPPGQSVAFVGPSGCGKTTLINLILGVFPPVEGDILIGDASLRRSGGEAPRALIGTVMQDDTLFAGSIADNICFFDPAPDRARIEECARLAQIHEEIAAMAMGYHTLVGDMGTVLSGGQKQRLFLARALYKQPRILVLDEATSHLDVTCEQAVNAAIQSLDLTRIIIAHRPETILSAERVVMLHGGKVVEDMPVSELVARQTAASTAQAAEAG
ncbi:MAG: peptidase domain-containing ABC transporter [Zoogloea sp.]|uniref:peptidase domain-containing ABC transporter n=1 Tax=Zoogloea sp. TaxID=49181 RepID=UPI002619D471|nr:peptidase domain-containing ABC transporter [Zoogloea sp.]MDD2988534.1 peptidase domain-containing ABC transporter [Zoogloea sp.]